nr:MAG TPA: hypothetical protein [Crassvirales sp.]
MITLAFIVFCFKAQMPLHDLLSLPDNQTLY